MAATTRRTWTSFRPPKICLHCRLELSSLCLGLQLNSCLLFALPWWRCVCGYGTTIYQPFTFKRFVWKQSVNFSLHCTCQMYDYSMNDSKVAWISDDYFESFFTSKTKIQSSNCYFRNSTKYREVIRAKHEDFVFRRNTAFMNLRDIKDIAFLCFNYWCSLAF